MQSTRAKLKWQIDKTVERKVATQQKNIKRKTHEIPKKTSKKNQKKLSMEICHVAVQGMLKREGTLKRKGEGELVSSKNYNMRKIYKQQFTYSTLLIRHRGSGIFC